MRLKIEIRMDGAAFTEYDAPGVEVGRMLAESAKRFADNPALDDGWSTALYDINGNEVGFATVEGGAR